MGFEVMPTFGRVCTWEARAALGPAWSSEDHVHLLVIDPRGGAVIDQVALTEMKAGRAFHRAFLCAGCGRPKTVLHADRGVLRCSRCLGRRTRRQGERTRADWRRRGGEQEDALLRLLLRRGGRAPAVLDRARRLMVELIGGDQDRFLALKPKIDAACCLPYVHGDSGGT